MNEPSPFVYVVDDDASVQQAIASLMRSVGLEVKTFGTSAEFLQWPRTDAPSCLILDVKLAETNGLVLQRELTEANIEIPIIFISGHGDIPMSVRAMKAGAVEFFTKPFRDQELLDAIRIGLERDRARRARNLPRPPHDVPDSSMQPAARFPQSTARLSANPPARTEPQVIRVTANAQIDGNPLRNRILLNLPDAECQLIFPRLVFVPLRQQDLLNEAGEPIRYGYFINSGLASILNVMEDGKSVEVGLSGHEGFVGVPLLVAFESSPSRVLVQIEGSAFRIGATALTELLAKCPTLQRRLQRYVQIVGLQSAQVAACNRLHQTEQRLARWLLMCQDRISSEFVPLTQEFLANMLGTRRSSVTVAAGILQRSGLISYTPGHVTILNRDGLESAACECYSAMLQQAAKWIEESA